MVDAGGREVDLTRFVTQLRSFVSPRLCPGVIPVP